MNHPSIAVFLPVRKGSERVKRKNTRPFAGFQYGLLEAKLSQILESEAPTEFLLSSNDDVCLDFGRQLQRNYPRLKVIQRPDHLGQSSTSLVDLIKYVPQITDCQHILWTHVTSPFLMQEDYDKAIEVYFDALEEGFDSLMSARPFQNFLWDKESGDLINRITKEKWPRTQDLKTLYEIDSGVFIANRNTYQMQNDRIGEKPYLFEVEGIKSFDIDWEEDFEIAEIIYEAKIKRNSLGF